MALHSIFVVSFFFVQQRNKKTLAIAIFFIVCRHLLHVDIATDTHDMWSRRDCCFIIIVAVIEYRNNPFVHCRRRRRRFFLPFI